MSVPRRGGNSNETIFAPPRTPEAQENQMISLAMDLAEKQLRDGTASSQTINHFLKLATVREQYELELLRAKADAISSQQHIEELYSNAIRAMRVYQGLDYSEDDTYED